MAFSVSDFEDLARLLSEHPEWRERLRPLILGEEVLQIPSRMDRVEAALEALTVRVDALAERLDLLTEEVRDLTAAVRSLDSRAAETAGRLNRIEGRLGNLEGGDLEGRYTRNLGSWFSKWLRHAERLSWSDLDLLDEAVSGGRLTAKELDDLHQLDMMVKGLDRTSADGESVVLAVEVSYTINSDDVSRASDRAGTLQKAGLRSRGFVGGYRVTEEAQSLAEKLNIIVDLHRPAA